MKKKMITLLISVATICSLGLLGCHVVDSGSSGLFAAHVHVLDPVGANVPGASVTLYEQGAGHPPQGSAVAEGQTDANGWFLSGLVVHGSDFKYYARAKDGFDQATGSWKREGASQTVSGGQDVYLDVTLY
jgi:hypothetical protein